MSDSDLRYYIYGPIGEKLRVICAQAWDMPDYIEYRFYRDHEGKPYGWEFEDAAVTFLNNNFPLESIEEEYRSTDHKKLRNQDTSEDNDHCSYAWLLTQAFKQEGPLSHCSLVKTLSNNRSIRVTFDSSDSVYIVYVELQSGNHSSILNGLFCPKTRGQFNLLFQYFQSLS